MKCCQLERNSFCSVVIIPKVYLVPEAMPRDTNIPRVLLLLVNDSPTLLVPKAKPRNTNNISQYYFYSENVPNHSLMIKMYFCLNTYLLLVNDQAHFQNINNNKKYCQYSLALPWVLTNQGNHLLIVIIPSVHQYPSASPRALNIPWVLLLHYWH